MLKKSFLLIISAITLSGCTIPFIGRKQAALQVNATPQAAVYIDGKHVGQTPYTDDKIKPGEYTVRVLVENDPTKDWQTTVTLQPKLVTVIEHAFGSTPEESANHILQLEPLISKTDTEISIVTIPDNVVVKLDGQPEGFSPVTIDDMGAGSHNLILSAPGYQEQTINATAQAGYKLIVSAQLAKASGLPTPPPANNPRA